MPSLLRRLVLLTAALLATGGLAACGGGNDNPDLNTAAAQTKCEKQEAKDLKGKTTDAQNTALCKCLLPKLTAAGFKKWDDVDAADKKHDPRLDTIGQACVGAVRGY